uniref:Uncharacterized protein n=1 Tax=Kalanchoe fedtschenkoi TaxID=63787 RepID=A0A7N0U382_KALFE
MACKSSDGKGSMYEEDEAELRRGPWTVEEDTMLIHYISCNGDGRWNMLAKCAGLKRTGKSCRLRWLNYLKPDVKRGNLSPQEQLLILELHAKWGNRWSKIAQHLPGRTDNEIKNFWRTRVQKQALQLSLETPDNQQIAASAFSQSNSPASSSAMSMSPRSNWHNTFGCNSVTPTLGESSSSSLHHQTPTNPSNVAYGNNVCISSSSPFHHENCYYVDNSQAADAGGGFGSVDAGVTATSGYVGRRNWVADDEVENGMWNNTDELWQFRYSSSN